MRVEITTVSKKGYQLFETPAAVYVLTREDLARSGIRSLPDALRLVPGLFIAQVDTNKWVVTSRGFSGVFSNKLLVLIDGRSVYTPLFSGVFWEAQDVPLSDIERIEVIRGSGGAIWGANAVNGIINIITSSAADTQGGHLQAGWGDEDPGFITLRYGDRLGDKTYFKIFGKGFRKDPSLAVARRPLNDGWEVARLGARIDRNGARQSLSLLGDFYTGNVGQTLSITPAPRPPFLEDVSTDANIRGISLWGRWDMRFGAQSDLAFQAYYDRSEREEFVLQGVIPNADLDIQPRFGLGTRHEAVWGLGYRFTSDTFDGTYSVSFTPDSRRVHLFSGFFQDEIWLSPNQIRLSLGSKLEHNSYTGFEYQPNVRLWWSPTPKHAFWIALARAVRTPSRGERDIRAIRLAFPADSLFTGSPVALARLEGSSDFRSETMGSLDAGYRMGLGNLFALDVAGFYHRYRNMRTNEPDIQAFEIVSNPPHLIVPVRVANKARGNTFGLETATDWQVTSRLRMRASYSYFQMDLKVSEDSFDTVTETFADENPVHQLNVRAHLDWSPTWRTNLIVRYVDQLETQEIKRYVTTDARLEWRPIPAFTLSLVGQNLLKGQHPEYISMSVGTIPTEVKRRIYGIVDWRY